MQPEAVAGTLDQLDEVKRRTRADLRVFWFPLVLFGGLTLVSAGVIVLFDDRALGVYWPLAGPLGGIATSWYYHRHERSVGVERWAAPHVATAVLIVVGASLAGGVGSATDAPLLAAVGPYLVVAAGYLVFAWLERSTHVAAVALALGGLAAVLGVAGFEAEAAALTLALLGGALLLGTGLWQRSLHSRRA